MSAATAASLSALLAISTTFAPFAAKALAVAAPIPLEAPVTTTVRPVTCTRGPYCLGLGATAAAAASRRAAARRVVGCAHEPLLPDEGPRRGRLRHLRPVVRRP